MTHHHEHHSSDKQQVKDPVCGMQIDPNSAFAKVEHGGRTYHFCSQHCLQKFDAAPEQYASSA